MIDFCSRFLGDLIYFSHFSMFLPTPGKACGVARTAGAAWGDKDQV